MSQRGRKNEKEENDADPSLGTALAAGAAAAAVAAFTYGAWRLYEYLVDSPSEAAASTDETAKKVCDSSDEDEVPSSSGRRARVTDGNRSAIASNPSRRSNNSRSADASASHSPCVKGVSLSDKILQYYHSYVDVSPTDVRDVTKVVKNVKMALARQLSKSERLRKLNVSAIKETGSSVDGLMVIFPRQFDILIPFDVSADECCVGPHGSSTDRHSIAILNDSHLWSDVCDDMNCLDPARFVILLSEILKEAVNRCGSENLKVTLQPASALIEGSTCGMQKYAINIVPALNIGGRCFTAEQCPVSTDGTSGSNVCWRESFFAQECDSLNRFGPGVSGHKFVVKIFKAVRLNFPLQFGILTSYHYKTVLLRTMDDQANATDWEMSAISERFIDFLMELGNCLKEKSLPHYYQKDCNLFDQISAESLLNLAHFINKIVGHQEIASLLKCDYVQ